MTMLKKTKKNKKIMMLCSKLKPKNVNLKSLSELKKLKKLKELSLKLKKLWNNVKTKERELKKT